MFTITAQPAVQLPGGGSTSFTVRLDPTRTGNLTATLHIANNDGDENPFDLTLTATGTLSSNANLASLDLGTGTLVLPAFASGTTSYSSSVVSYISTITVTPGVAQSTATIRVNGAAVASGSPSQPVNLAVGSNSIAIVVTAGDGVSTRTYNVDVTRPAPGPGDLDVDFAPNLSFEVYSVAVQPDGKTLVGGPFYGGAGVARLLSDGSLESSVTFNPPTSVDGQVGSINVQADGKILLTGNFSDLNGQPRNGIARLNANGTVESTDTFDPGTGSVYSVAVQADGRILLGGGFYTVHDQERRGIARLNVDGSLESAATFNPGLGPDSHVSCVTQQADGKILLAGDFTSVNGQPRGRIARLNANGTVESTATFNPGTGANGSVYAVLVQADGKILLAGDFTSVNGQPRNRIARLNANGTVESTATFNPGTGPDGYVNLLALQANGKILLTGAFTTVNGQPRNGMARLNSNGTVESTTTFSPAVGAGSFVAGLALQGDGRILLHGSFTSISDQPRSNFARLLNDAAVQTLSIPDSTRVQWVRGGAAPEVEQVVFELSTDGGTTFSVLGAATRIAGGWEKTGLNLPPAGQIRARGRTSGRSSNSSSGLVEQVASFPLVAPSQPLQLAQLGNASATDADDPDHDGIVTLAEYGLNLPPGTANGAPFAAGRFAYPDGERLRVFVQRNPAHNDVTVQVQVADDLSGPWTPLATSTLGAPFAGPGYVGGDAATPGVKTVEIRDTVNMKDAPARFVRVEVTR